MSTTVEFFLAFTDRTSVLYQIILSIFTQFALYACMKKNYDHAREAVLRSR